MFAKYAVEGIKVELAKIDLEKQSGIDDFREEQIIIDQAKLKVLIFEFILEIIRFKIGGRILDVFGVLLALVEVCLNGQKTTGLQTPGLVISEPNSNERSVRWWQSLSSTPAPALLP